MIFEFTTANRIVFGSGKLSDTAPAARTWGKRVLIVHSPHSPGVKLLAEGLAHEGITHELWEISGEPTVEDILEGLNYLRNSGSEVVIGVGGGSVLDAAKAVAGLYPNPGEPKDYLEVVGRGLPLKVPALPMIAIPTTSGTGSEVTRNAVLSVPENKVKVSLRSPYLIPRLAIVDPSLTLSLPASVTAYTGMDALTQLIEPFVSRKANSMTDLICLEGVQRVRQSFLAVIKDGGNLGGREDMAYASLLGGMALTNSGLGAVHGLAAPLGGRYKIPHGALCARLLPEVVRVNIMAMNARAPHHVSLLRYQKIASVLTGKPEVNVESLAGYLEELIEELRIPRLSSMGINRQDFLEIVKNAIGASSMQANPIVLERDELLEVLEKAY